MPTIPERLFRGKGEMGITYEMLGRSETYFRGIPNSSPRRSIATAGRRKDASIVDSRQVEAQLKEPALHRMIVVFEQNALMPLRDADKRRLEKSRHIVVECGQVNVVARRANV